MTNPAPGPPPPTPPRPTPSLQGSAASLWFTEHSPFRPFGSWTLYLARRALLRTAREIAEGLRALHDHGTCHGALKVRGGGRRPAGCSPAGLCVLYMRVGAMHALSGLVWPCAWPGHR